MASWAEREFEQWCRRGFVNGRWETDLDVHRRTIRATIHEAARRVCTCLPGEFLEREGHEERCPARKVLEMEASGG